MVIEKDRFLAGLVFRVEVKYVSGGEVEIVEFISLEGFFGFLV